jgi:hypothetical protein
MPFGFKKIAVNFQFQGWNKALLVLEKFFHYPHWFFKFSRVKNCSSLGSLSFFRPGNVILQTYGFMINSAEKFLLGTGTARRPPPPLHAWIASVRTAAILGLVLLGVG